MEFGRKLARDKGTDLVEHGKNGRIRGVDTPAGYGALKGEFVTRRGIDVAKPILEQTLRNKRR